MRVLMRAPNEETEQSRDRLGAGNGLWTGSPLRRAHSRDGASQQHTGKEMAVCFQITGKGYICQINDFIVTI